MLQFNNDSQRPRISADRVFEARSPVACRTKLMKFNRRMNSKVRH